MCSDSFSLISPPNIFLTHRDYSLRIWLNRLCFAKSRRNGFMDDKRGNTISKGGYIDLRWPVEPATKRRKFAVEGILKLLQFLSPSTLSPTKQKMGVNI